jgi:hypothetical protein
LPASRVTIQRVAEERCFEKHGLQNNSRAGATPVCAALEPPQTRFVPTVTLGVAPALEELPSVMRSSSDENLESADRNAVKSGARNDDIVIHFPKELGEPSSRSR